MKSRLARLASAAALAAGVVLAGSTTPASASLLLTAYADFDGLAPGPGCTAAPTPVTVPGGWEIASDTGSVSFCPGNLNASSPPDAGHLETPPGTTTLQQDVATNPGHHYYVSYTVAAVSPTLTTEVTIDGDATTCESDTSTGPATCNIAFQPTATTTSITVTIPNSLATNVELDDLYVWVPA